MKNNFWNWTKISERFWKNKCYPVFFKNVKRGDDEEIIKRLEDKDKYYPKDYRKKYRKLKFKYYVPSKRKVKEAKMMVKEVENVIGLIKKKLKKFF